MKQDWCDTCTNTTCPYFFPFGFFAPLIFKVSSWNTSSAIIFELGLMVSVTNSICKSWVWNMVFQFAACNKFTKVLQSIVIQHFQNVTSLITHMILKHLSCIICRLRRFYEWHCREFVRCVFLSFIIFLSQLLKSRRNRSSRVWKFLLLTKKLLLCVLTLKHFQWHSYQTTYLLLH